jgi:hypothetical protein
VPDEPALKALLERVHRLGIRAQSFQEEDLGGETTAFATELISGDKRLAFRQLRLLKGRSLQAA